MKASLSDDVDLDGWVTAGVVDLASVNLGDRHYGVSLGKGRILALRPLKLDYGEERGWTDIYDIAGIGGSKEEIKRQLTGKEMRRRRSNES